MTSSGIGRLIPRLKNRVRILFPLTTLQENTVYSEELIPEDLKFLSKTSDTFPCIVVDNDHEDQDRFDSSGRQLYFLHNGRTPVIPS